MWAKKPIPDEAEWIIKLVEEKYPRAARNIRRFWWNIHSRKYFEEMLTHSDSRSHHREGFDPETFMQIANLNQIHKRTFKQD